MGSNGLKEKHTEKRLGEENYNSYGRLMKIIRYNSSKSIIVEFQDEYKTKLECRYDQFKKGTLVSPYDKTVLNIGYIGEGKYNHKDYHLIWEYWNDLICRNYNPYFINKHLTYKDCFIEDDLLCFQNFAKWFEENYYECNGEQMCIDKDILIKGNKIYSKDTMIFVPQSINKLFIKQENKRGNHPIGVSWDENSKKFRAYVHVKYKNEKSKQIFKRFDTELEAFYWYKEQKEKEIKRRADEYKDLIPQRLYEAMINYKIEIND